MTSSDLAFRISNADFSACAATVVGYGAMGSQFVKALQALGVGRIHVCSRSDQELENLKGQPGIRITAGGFQNLRGDAAPDELAIVAVPICDLVNAALHLASLGFRRILIEKPVSLWSLEIEKLASHCARLGIDAVCGYNRVAYPSFHETLARATQEGGITSCTYTFTEFVNRLDPQRYTPSVMKRWGVANSLHVIAMAHGIIGLPQSWSGYRVGSLSWHPTGRVFTGAGVSANQVPFAYHADWGSTGRWSVEIHTRESSYRLCPLEQLARRMSPTGQWEDVPITAFAPAAKPGFAEQVAAMLDSELRQEIPLIDLETCVALTRLGEDMFGYSRDQ